MVLAWALLVSTGLAVQPPEAWERADQETRRLAPSAFGALPAAIRGELERRGCTIPQVHTGGAPHNVISGRFRPGSKGDVAVLCSRARTSTILVFWDGDPGTSEELAARPDSLFLQAVGRGQLGFSRAILPATPEYIHRQHRRHGGPAPPAGSHHGIEDAFVEKASLVWYWHEGTWLQLTGAD